MNKLKYLFLLMTVLSVGLTAGGLALAHNESESHDKMTMPPIRIDKKINIVEDGNVIKAVIHGATVTQVPYVSGGDAIAQRIFEVKIFGQKYKIQPLEAPQNLSNLVAVGDIVNVHGTLDSNDPFLIHAKDVKNFSRAKPAAVYGIIKNITPPDTFTIENGSKIITVATNANTIIFEGQAKKSFADLKIGMKVIAKGILDKTASKLHATLISINPFAVIY